MRIRKFLLLGVVLAFGCNYGFQGGGGFPSHIRTVFIEPFENQTVQLDLESPLYTKLMEEVPRALGVRQAGREVADVIIRGRIIRYDDSAQNYRASPSGDRLEVLENQVEIAVAVEIVDVRENVILWESSSVTGLGKYSDAQTDVVGRDMAIEIIVKSIIDGAQSQW